MAAQSDSPLLQERHIYKPFLYPWCYEAWLTQQRIHWLPEEVPLAEDVRDWKKTLTPSEKNLMTQIKLLQAIVCEEFSSFLPKQKTAIDELAIISGKCTGIGE